MESNATKPDKDVIYTLRCAHQKQSQLVILADHKAQILSGLALVVLTLLGTRLIFMNTEGLLDSYSNLTILLFILFCVSEIIAITLGIFVVMPNLPTKKKTEIKIENIQNPLFFGAFSDFSEEEYLDHIAQKIVCNNSARMYLAKDIYQSGMVLSEKYRKLSHAYRYALLGFVFLVFFFLSLFLF